ncbi:MAG: hypothetical protein IJN03_00195 [Bacilli bacterium]|nr:hypothetical protein [Bacilli bacterium]
MGNLMTNLKKFISNKNTVTILGVILGVVVLYIGYNYRVKQAIELVSIPYATQAIAGKTKITSEMISTVEVNRSFLRNNPNVITDINKLIDQYVNYGMPVPNGAFFYTDQVVAEKQLNDSAFNDIPDGYTIFTLKVDLHTTYGNSIYPGNYIDLYLKAIDDTNRLIYGQFITSIEVLAVKDSAGNHVFEGASTGTPAELLFAVPDEMYKLLMKADLLTSNSIEIIPVPRNASYTSNKGETSVTSEYLKNFILSKSATIPDEFVNNTVTE